MKHETTISRTPVHVHPLGMSRETESRGCLVKIYPPGDNQGLIDLPHSRYLIGRDAECDLTVDDSSVSRRHASIDPVDGEYLLSDLSSTNGTFVNEDRVTTRVLANGDFLRVGSHIFKFLESDNIEAQYHETIYSMMTTDGLTGARNKRYLLEAFDRELARAHRRARPLALAMIDIDHFKSINDTHGHLTGDAILREVCDRIRKEVRSDEIFARFGGEEFVVLMPEASLEEAVVFANRLRARIADQPFRVHEKEIPVTISIGVAITQGDRSVFAEDLIAAADEKLYEAKNTGRNRVCS
ncbi:MAG: GGDEF domain-containing protein [Planctomycetota bacterium]